MKMCIIQDNKIVELVNPDFQMWLDWMLENETKVEHTIMDTGEYVDTRFTGIMQDDNTCYQTFILGGPAHGTVRAYRTHEEAQRGHSQLVNWLLNGGKNDGNQQASH